MKAGLLGFWEEGWGPPVPWGGLGSRSLPVAWSTSRMERDMRGALGWEMTLTQTSCPFLTTSFAEATLHWRRQGVKQVPPLEGSCFLC